MFVQVYQKLKDEHIFLCNLTVDHLLFLAIIRIVERQKGITAMKNNSKKSIMQKIYNFFEDGAHALTEAYDACHNDYIFAKKFNNQ